MQSGSDIEALKTLISHHQFLADGSTVTVFIGLLLEIVNVFLFRKDGGRSETILSFVCALVIAIGVFGEYRYGSKAAQENSQLQSKSEATIASLNVEAAELNQKAAALGEEAERERLARIRIEENVAWRRLSHSQQEQIGALLRHFPGVTGSVWFNASDVEGHAFALDIVSAFRDANWKVLGPGAILNLAPASPTPPPLSTGVRVTSTGDSLGRKASNDLVRDLNAFGFDCVLSSKIDPHPGPVVWVNVESRPFGPQGDAKLDEQRRVRGNAAARR